MLVDVVAEFADEVRPPGRRRGRRGLRGARRRCSRPRLEIGLPILGVPEALGGIAEERSAMAGTLVAEALAQGDMGLAVAAARARRRRHRARRCGAPTSSSRPTCRPSPATTSRPPRSRSPSRTVLFDPLAPATTADRAPATASSSTA